MKKYRVRLSNGRVVGPYEVEQIEQLKIRGRISGDEEFQIFPTGDWLSIDRFEDLKEIKQIEEKIEEEATFIKKINLEELKNESASEEEFPKKFEYEKKTPFSDREIIEDEPVEEVVEEVAEEAIEKKVEENEITETISSNNQISTVEDKTLVNLNTKEYLEELKKQKEEEEKQKKLAEEEEAKKEPEVDIDNDSTQLVDLGSLKDELKRESKEVEQIHKKEEKEHKREIKKLKLELEEKKRENIEEDEDDSDDSGLKRKKIIFFACILAILYVVLTPDEPKKKKVEKIIFKYPQISFPIRFDQPDKLKAKELYDKGISLYRTGEYINTIKSSLSFRKSLENKFNDNPAAAKLIFTYSLLLDNSQNREDDANTIFKLVQVFKSKALLDANFASAISLFYFKTKKFNAAVSTFEKYNAIKKSNPTVELFAVYLKSLLKVGDLIKAKAIVKKIETVEIRKRSMFTNLALIDYYRVLGEYEKPGLIISESKKIFKKSIPLNLESARLLFYNEDYKSLERLLKQLRLNNLDYSKVYYSKYLEYMGLLSVKKAKVKAAEKYFEKALKTFESLELRSKLASLYEEGATDSNVMIAESKALQLISSSKLHIEERNWKFAFKDALEASRIAPNFIPAKLHLTNLQIKQSIFKEAIVTLEKLYKLNSNNPEIVFTLIDAYIESYKFTDVRRLLTILNTSELRSYPKYISLTAKYYIYKDDFRNSVSWLQKAINRNPLNDENRFELAKLFIKYNKFNRAKSNLNKAMDLNPARVEYRIAYSKILYESDGSDTAIGYLYNILQDFPDNPKLLSQIGIFYYRSGQIKSFESIKDKLQNIPKKDSTLYEFLIQAAKIDDNQADEIKYSKKKIELDPGDLKTRLNLGKLFMDMEKYKESLIEFKAIEERLDTYPSLQLYMSNLYLLTENNEKAAELAIKEIKANASSELGYIMYGNILSKQKKYIEAEKQYKKAQKINGDNVDMLIGLAKISFKKSQYDLALDLFLKARENAPERAEIHKLLGDAYRKLSQSSLAIESYKLFLELSPTSKYKGEINTFIQTMQ